jgi:hypothetical protein
MNFKLFKEILTEKCHDGTRPYSQGRFYLFLSVAAYFVTIGFVEYKALNPNTNLNMDSIGTVFTALQWTIALFAGYAFGGKGIDAVKAVMSSKYLAGLGGTIPNTDAVVGQDTSVTTAATTVVTNATTTNVVATNTGSTNPLVP